MRNSSLHSKMHTVCVVLVCVCACVQRRAIPCCAQKWYGPRSACVCVSRVIMYARTSSARLHAMPANRKARHLQAHAHAAMCMSVRAHLLMRLQVLVGRRPRATPYHAQREDGSSHACGAPHPLLWLCCCGAAAQAALRAAGAARKMHCQSWKLWYFRYYCWTVHVSKSGNAKPGGENGSAVGTRAESAESGGQNGQSPAHTAILIAEGGGGAMTVAFHWSRQAVALVSHTRTHTHPPQIHAYTSTRTSTHTHTHTHTHRKHLKTNQTKNTHARTSKLMHAAPHRQQLRPQAAAPPRPAAWRMNQMPLAQPQGQTWMTWACPQAGGRTPQVRLWRREQQFAAGLGLCVRCTKLNRRGCVCHDGLVEPWQGACAWEGVLIASCCFSK